MHTCILEAHIHIVSLGLITSFGNTKTTVSGENVQKIGINNESKSKYKK